MANEILAIKAIRIDGGTQSRQTIDAKCVKDYAELVKDGHTFPPIEVFHDGKAYWLADGFHRHQAHLVAGKSDIAANVRKGTKRDAVLYSCGANGTHGKQRSKADKHRAVTTLLKDKEWSAWSDREIARKCCVGHTFVAKVRKKLNGIDSIQTERTYTTRHGTTATRTVPAQPQADANPSESDTSEAAPAQPTEPEPDTSPTPPADDPEPVVQSGADEPAEEAASLEYLPEVFGKAAWFLNASIRLGHLRTEFRETATSAAGAMLDLQDCENAIKQLQNNLRFGAPNAICPSCQRDAKTGCKLCKGRGWIGVTELAYLTNEQKAWIAENKV